MDGLFTIQLVIGLNLVDDFNIFLEFLLILFINYSVKFINYIVINNKIIMLKVIS